MENEQLKIYTEHLKWLKEGGDAEKDSIEITESKINTLTKGVYSKQEADKYQELFNFFSQEHNLTLTISEMNEIIYEVNKFQIKYDEN